MIPYIVFLFFACVLCQRN